VSMEVNANLSRKINSLFRYKVEKKKRLSSL
jgi:hypothetical protein